MSKQLVPVSTLCLHTHRHPHGARSLLLPGGWALPCGDVLFRYSRSKSDLDRLWGEGMGVRWGWSDNLCTVHRDRRVSGSLTEAHTFREACPLQAHAHSQRCPASQSLFGAPGPVHLLVPQDIA